MAVTDHDVRSLVVDLREGESAGQFLIVHHLVETLRKKCLAAAEMLTELAEDRRDLQGEVEVLQRMLDNALDRITDLELTQFN